MVMIHSHLQLQPVDIYIRATKDKGANKDRPLIDWNSLPRFSKTLGQHVLTSGQNRQDWKKFKEI